MSAFKITQVPSGPNSTLQVGGVASGDLSGTLPAPTVSGIAGHPIATGADSPGGAIFSGIVISPAQLVANTDNWSPTGLSTADVIRVSTDASRNLTGIVAPASAWAIVLENVGSFDLVLKHNVTSTAANRFFCPNDSDVTLQKDSTVLLVYDLTSLRWRVIGGGGGGVSGAAFPIVCVFDAGTSALVANSQADAYVIAAGTITAWTMLGDVSGSAVIDVWKVAIASSPPTVANTIINTGAGGVKPTLSGAQHAQSASVANWTTSLAVGDTIRFNLDSASTCKRVTLVITYTRT